MTPAGHSWWRVTLTLPGGRRVEYCGHARDECDAIDAGIRALIDDHPTVDHDATTVTCAWLGKLQPAFCGGPSDFVAGD